MRRSTMLGLLGLLATSSLSPVTARAAAAQTGDAVRITSGVAGGSGSIDVSRPGGFAAIPAAGTAAAGWRWARSGDRWIGRAGPELVIEVRENLPFAFVAGDVVQLAHAPFREGDELYLPVQLVIDVLPDRFPDHYGSPGDGRTLRVLDEGLLRESAARMSASPATGDVHDGDVPAERAVRVVIIDPGHGGEDPGAMGPGGEREKDVALGIALELARVLSEVPDLEVHLTRDRDVLVPLWERGARATEIKGDRPGLFLSIHANAVPDRTVRGFETYFLSEARTEHEARVAALENSAFRRGRDEGPDLAEDSELGFILNELRNFDHQHWSADLAAVVQRRLSAVHPGPDRGVKQGPLAVITNSLMPSVLVEIGFISHPGEAASLADDTFRREVGRALAEAALEFLDRYPPGGSTATGSR